MLYSDFASSLARYPGVVRFEILSQDALDEVMSLEYSPRNIGFTPVDPEGIREVMRKQVTLVLFCNARFPMFTQPCMDILDKNGRLIGFDILDEDKHIFNSENFIWLTNNLFVDIAQLDTRGDLVTVIHSVSLNMPDVPEDVRPRVYYPSSETADYLNSYYGMNDGTVSTVILGADIVQFT